MGHSLTVDPVMDRPILPTLPHVVAASTTRAFCTETAFHIRPMSFLHFAASMALASLAGSPRVCIEFVEAHFQSFWPLSVLHVPESPLLSFVPFLHFQLPHVLSGGPFAQLALVPVQVLGCDDLVPGNLLQCVEPLLRTRPVAIRRHFRQMSAYLLEVSPTACPEGLEGEPGLRSVLRPAHVGEQRPAPCPNVPDDVFGLDVVGRVRAHRPPVRPLRAHGRRRAVPLEGLEVRSAKVLVIVVTAASDVSAVSRMGQGRPVQLSVRLDHLVELAQAEFVHHAIAHTCRQLLAGLGKQVRPCYLSLSVALSIGIHLTASKAVPSGGDMRK